MVLFLEIECVKRDGNCITAIHGSIAPQSSEQRPTPGTLRAIDEAKGPAWWMHPKHGKLSIMFFKMNGKNCFFVEDPDDPSHNLLAELPDC